MYIMLVDDEPLILKGVERFILKAFPWHETATFTNPLEALVSIQLRKPDLLITDQCMPELTGFELVEKAVELGCKYYAILTGYDEFSLVQKALRLHATDYLTKPVNKQDLYQLIENTEKQLSQKELMPVSDLISVLRVLAFWNVDSTEFESLSLNCDPRIQAKEAALILVSAQDADKVKKMIHSCRFMEMGLTPAEKYGILIFDIPESKLNEIVQTLSNECGFAGYAYQTPWHIDMLSSLYRRSVLLDSDDIQKFEALIKNPSNTADARKELKKMFYRHNSSLYDTVEALRQAFFLLGFETTSWNLLQFVSSLLEQNCEGTCNVENFIISLQPKTEIHSKQIIEAIAYIDIHYSEELNLHTLASHLYLQSSYFSNLFRKEVGISFIKYLNRVRIENACKLIWQYPDGALDNLSYQVGFVNPQYFFRVFKSHTNCTPGEYRKLYQSLSEKIQKA